MKKSYMLFSFTMLLLLTTVFPFKLGHTTQVPETKSILFLNSYHSGYKWSDDIYDGIKSVLNSDTISVNLQVEYMDTQRVVENRYLQSLFDTYKYKFRDRHFDLIIASDDNAFNFLLDYGDSLFPNTPVVFCGVNYFEQSMLHSHDLITGVVEGFDISTTIDTAVSLQPNTNTIYYVVDNTTTGLSIMKELLIVLPEYTDQLDFIRLDGENFDEITKKAQNLPDNSVILYLVYFMDSQGKHFEYNEAISLLEQNSSTPIYGVWDFTLSHGIIGGKLTSGFYQGKTAANIAVRILDGEHPSDIPVVTEETTYFGFDYRLLDKNNIKADALPPNSIVINAEKTKNKKILFLHSYNKGLQWTDDLELGAKSKLFDSKDTIEFTYEYMDVKNYTDPVYLQNMYELLIKKHTQTSFDLIIATDDVAFNFVRNYHDTLYNNVPTLFCGVNYFEESMLENNEFITGVVESYDLRGTIDVALSIDPNIKNIIVINDTTVTGEANRKNLDLLLPDYEHIVNFEIWDNYNMSEVQEKVKNLTDDSVILLLSFNQDKSNNSFTYDESIILISEYASVPIYGVWDFYLGEGLLGGVLTSGFTHGQAVGDMAVAILNGEKVSNIPVVTKSPNIYMFDYNVLKKFNISTNLLPDGSIIINEPTTFLDFYNSNKNLIIPFTFTLVVLCMIVLLMHLQIKSRVVAQKRERVYALTDPLTGIPNRRAGIEYLSKLLKKSKENGFQTTICFLDVNKLKHVNDNLGHREGDALLQTLCSLIQLKLRESDMLCRFAGDEFLIIFHDANLTEAKQVLERIHVAIKDHNQTTTDPYAISFSYGFAQYSPEDKSIDDLIERADSEMYANKVLNYS